MEGYEVLTHDDKIYGRVAEVRGDVLVVERGTLFKKRTALPREMTQVDDAGKAVRTTLSKELLDEAPTVNGELDFQAVAAYYGLAGGVESPDTEGYGDVLPDDPALTAEQDARRLGADTAEEERLRVRTGEGRLDRPESPGLTGGDRFRDAQS